MAGSYRLVHPDMSITEAGDLAIELSPRIPTRSSYLILVGQGPFFVRVIFEKLKPALSRLETLDLPSPKNRMPLTPSRTEDPECCICMNAILEGDLDQGLRSCSHRFHSNCVRRWLEFGQLSCPTCRCDVKYKS